MSDFSNIIQEINTNLPDNTTQSITAAKMRTTLIDVLNDVNTKKQDTLTFDNTPTQGSINPVTSGGVYTAMQNVSTTFESGQEVSEVSIVNNLTTGGSNDVLSAEQGKVLMQEVNQLEQEFVGLTDFNSGQHLNRVSIINNLTTGGSNDVLSAEQGKVLYNSTPSVENSSAEADLEISDEDGNVLVRFADGHIKVKNFDSADAAAQSEIEVGDSSDADLDISDEQGNVLARFANGHIKVKNFDSANTQSEIQDINSDIEEINGDIEDIREQIGSTTTERIGNTFSSVRKQSTVVFDSEGVGVIFEASGSGCIENMFFAGDNSNWHNPESCVLDVYCDGVVCLSGKLYELASMCLDFATHTDYETIHLETQLFAKLGNKNSINLNFKIPYYSSCRVTLTQPTPGVTDMVWSTVIARDVINIVYGGIKIPNNAYFKGIRQSNQTISNGDYYTIMDCNKQHCVVIGINLFLNGNVNNYSLEGCLRAYNKDNNTYYYLSSGLEDFFLGTYYFDSGMYQRYNVGLTYFKQGKLAAYRQFTDRPICFSNHTSKITVRNGDCVILNGETPGYPSAPIYTASDAIYGGFCFYYEW